MLKYYEKIEHTIVGFVGFTIAKVGVLRESKVEKKNKHEKGIFA